MYGHLPFHKASALKSSRTQLLRRLPSLERSLRELEAKYAEDRGTFAGAETACALGRTEATIADVRNRLQAIDAELDRRANLSPEAAEQQRLLEDAYRLTA